VLPRSWSEETGESTGGELELIGRQPLVRVCSLGVVNPALAEMADALLVADHPVE
jgi:hypothetical protein